MEFVQLRHYTLSMATSSTHLCVCNVMHDNQGGEGCGERGGGRSVGEDLTLTAEHRARVEQAVHHDKSGEARMRRVKGGSYKQLAPLTTLFREPPWC